MFPRTQGNSGYVPTYRMKGKELHAEHAENWWYS